MQDIYTITEQYHEKKEVNIYVLRLTKKISRDDFDELRETARIFDGYYSKYRGVNGFVFQTEEDAQAFGEALKDFFAQFDNNDDAESANEESVISKSKRKVSEAHQPAPISMTSHMPLHEALRNVIQTEGSEIINDVRVVNILDDFHAYDDSPISKYILRAIIADGYAFKLLSVGAWNNKAKQIASHFSQTTGFIPDAVESIFQAIAYALNWTQTITSDTKLQQENPKPSPTVPAKWSARMNDEAKNQFLLSMVEIEHDTEYGYGVSIQNISFDVDSDKDFTIFCELVNDGQINDMVFLHVAIYNHNGRIKYNNTVNLRYAPDIHAKPISCLITEIKADKISRIRLWLE